jgi:hypothetical protein
LDEKKDALRITLGLDEAAHSLGISRDSFDRHVAPHVRIIYLGARKLVSVAELKRWAETAGTRAA